jgi:hypothetical protein
MLIYWIVGASLLALLSIAIVARRRTILDAVGARELNALSQTCREMGAVPLIIVAGLPRSDGRPGIGEFWVIAHRNLSAESVHDMLTRANAGFDGAEAHAGQAHAN